jgi:hypothetical protein
LHRPLLARKLLYFTQSSTTHRFSVQIVVHKVVNYFVPSVLYPAPSDKPLLPSNSDENEHYIVSSMCCSPSHKHNPPRFH